MKNYTDSDYALNKYSEGIVYRFADKIIEVALEDYLTENPGKTEDDFLKLKAFSDADYHESDKSGYRQSWKNVPIGDLAETNVCSVPSAEYAVVDEPEEAERMETRLTLAKGALDKLTEVQRRRYIQYHADGLSSYKIAELEGKDHKTILESLRAAEKKIKKFLADD